MIRAIGALPMNENELYDEILEMSSLKMFRCSHALVERPQTCGAMACLTQTLGST